MASLDFRPINQFICLSLRLIWVFFAVMCDLHVDLWSSISPRYFTLFLTGSCAPFIVTCRQSFLPFVNVTCADLVSLTLHASRWARLQAEWGDFEGFGTQCKSFASVLKTVVFWDIHTVLAKKRFKWHWTPDCPQPNCQDCEMSCLYSKAFAPFFLWIVRHFKIHWLH